MRDPQFTADRCDRLRDAFVRAGYDFDGVRHALGPAAHAAMLRSAEPEPVVRATRGMGELGTLIRLWQLGESVPADEVATAIAPLALDDAIAAGLIAVDGDRARATVEIRPYGAVEGSWWVCSDFQPRRRGGGMHPEHVLGVGVASAALASATPRTPAASMLDVGCGNGIQALHAADYAGSITATDVSTRALALAEGNFLLNGIDAELLRGPWFEPVGARRFERIVCNPPFVIGPPRVDFTFRDSGLGADDAVAAVVGELPAHLQPGGSGHVLAEWLHRAGEDWAERVAGWVPAATDAWFVQRHVREPFEYVGTWLTDAGIDTTSPEGRAKTAEWLDWFAAERIEAVGYGYVTLRRVECGEPTVVCESAGADVPGFEVAEWLDRTAWLRSHPNLLGERFAVPDTVVLSRYQTIEDRQWQTGQQDLFRVDGSGRRPVVGESTASLLAACGTGAELGDVVAGLAAAEQRPVDEVAGRTVDTVAGLVRIGMLLPAELT